MKDLPIQLVSLLVLLWLVPSSHAGELQEACCFSDGSCLDLDAGLCIEFQGTSQGLGSTCATTFCQQPPQACCLSDGSCFDVDLGFCLELQGTSQGPSPCLRERRPTPMRQKTASRTG
jgi:hypothetical protein